MCVCACRAPPTRKFIHSGDKVLFETGMYVPALLPKNCYIGYEIRHFSKKDFLFFLPFSSHIDMAFPIRDLVACKISVSPSLGKGLVSTWA
jgi:hypothetical protein